MGEEPFVQFLAPVRLSPRVVAVLGVDGQVHLAAALLERTGKPLRAARGNPLVAGVVKDPDRDVLHRAEAGWDLARGHCSDRRDLLRIAERELERRRRSGRKAGRVNAGDVHTISRGNVVQQRRQRIGRPETLLLFLRRHDHEGKVGERLEDARQSLPLDEPEVAAALSGPVKEEDDGPTGPAVVRRRKVNEVSQPGAHLRGLPIRRSGNGKRRGRAAAQEHGGEQHGGQ
jgi:hypothetical protein